MKERKVFYFSVSCVFCEYSKHLDVDMLSVVYKGDGLRLDIYACYSCEMSLKRRP
jgi:hypothetical protein